MKFYIATRLDRHAFHNEVRDALIDLGHKITYDWTTHGPVWRSGKDVICQTAIAEMRGVKDADFVVVLLPGGRGTHAELGMALAFDKAVLIAGVEEGLFEAAPETCAFYHHPNVFHVTSLDANEIAAAADKACAIVERCMFIANDGSSRCLVQRRHHDAMSRMHPFDGVRERRGIDARLRSANAPKWGEEQ